MLAYACNSFGNSSQEGSVSYLEWPQNGLEEREGQPLFHDDGGHRIFPELVSGKALRRKGYTIDIFFLASEMEIIHNNVSVFLMMILFYQRR